MLKGRWSKNFSKDIVFFSMKVGEISDPVKTDYGYHLISVTDKKEAKEANFDDHNRGNKADLVCTILWLKFQTEYSTWITEQREKLEIENMLDKE